MLRFRHVHARPTTSGLYPEIVLINSHDGLSSYRHKNDLFTVFNVAQENLIKGGVQGYTKDKRGRTKRISTRAIQSIDQNNAINRALWTLAEKMMQLKGA